MIYIYKLVFATEKEFLNFRKTLEIKKNGLVNFKKPIERIVIGGYQIITPAIYDNGKIITDAVLGKYEVDIITSKKLASLDAYKCGIKSKQWHTLYSFNHKDITYVY